jgi:undecaprenyl-diphosphatase
MPRVLAGAGVIAAGIVLVLLAGIAIGRWPFPFDGPIVTGLRHWGGPRWLAHAAGDVTALGGGTVLTIVVILVAGLLAVQRLWLSAASILLASATGGMAVDLIKSQVLRARPNLVPHLVPASGYSFPSGHAASSAVVYLTIAAIAGQVTPTRAIRRYLLGCAILLVGVIGSSRVYLGVHWPSDVLVGWSFGTLWALGWWIATAHTRVAIGGER